MTSKSTAAPTTKKLWDRWASGVAEDGGGDGGGLSVMLREPPIHPLEAELESEHELKTPVQHPSPHPAVLLHHCHASHDGSPQHCSRQDC